MNRRRALVGALVAGLAAMSVSCGDQEPGAFAPRGSAAGDLNRLFWLMVVLGGAVFVLVLVLFARAASAGRSRSTDDHADGDDPVLRVDPDGDDEHDGRDERSERRSSRLVIGGGVVLPIVVLIPLTVVMLVVGNRLSPRLGDAYEIRVVGHQYWWEVEYPSAGPGGDTDGDTAGGPGTSGGVVTANEIHIPTGTRVRIVMESADVIHSFWVPQLAGKIDMIPGQATEVVIDADEPGTYLGQCAEFCGVQHARMRFLVIAQPPDEFEQWLADQSADALPPATDAARRGADTFTEVGCAACHSVRGTDATGDLGPDLTHLASRTTLGAVTVPNERGQLGGWITDPQAVKPGNLMPPTPLTSEQLLDLIEYLEGLG